MNLYLKFSFQKWWRNVFRANRKHYKSMASEPKVTELYEYILKHQFTDSDWWPYAAQDIQCMLDSFNDMDWTGLRNDVANWEMFQLEILAYVLSYEYSNRQVSDVMLSSKSELFTYVFTIADSNTRLSMLEDIDFILVGFSKPRVLLHRVKDRLNTIDYEGKHWDVRGLDGFRRRLDEEISTAQF